MTFYILCISLAWVYAKNNNAILSLSPFLWMPMINSIFITQQQQPLYRSTTKRQALYIILNMLCYTLNYNTTNEKFHPTQVKS